MQQHINTTSEVKRLVLAGNKMFPNNLDLPVIVYQHVLNLPESEESDFIEDIFEQNGWSNSWRDTIYTYHHYHSNAHEVLGVSKGRCMLMLGGDDEVITTLEKGDVIVIPAGVAHKNVGSSDDFECVGAYPGGSSYDLKRGGQEELETSRESIKKVALPESDPVFGHEGPILEHWAKQHDKKAIETRPQF